MDTSCSRAGLCLVVPTSKEIHTLQPEAKSLPSESLVSAIAALLTDHGLSVAELGSIVVGVGPGSFTGLRVGLATVKGMAMGCKFNVFGVSSLAILAGSFGPGRVLVALNARRGDVFIGEYIVAEDSVETVGVDTVMPATDLPDLCSGADIVVGDAWEAYPELERPQKVRLIDKYAPDAAWALIAAAPGIEAGRGTSALELAPLYLRVSEAERQVQERS
jgi:tRNA threonylcarbamoyladenosine biosynthesis protein TsaB